MSKQPKETKQNLTARQYEKLGRLIERTALAEVLDRKQMLKNSFLKGLAGGLGGVIGATIVVALLLWILSLLNHLPFVGPISDGLQNTIETRKK